MSYSPWFALQYSSCWLGHMIEMASSDINYKVVFLYKRGKTYLELNHFSQMCTIDEADVKFPCKITPINFVGTICALSWTWQIAWPYCFTSIVLVAKRTLQWLVPGISIICLVQRTYTGLWWNVLWLFHWEASILWLPHIRYRVYGFANVLLTASYVHDKKE